LIAVRGGGDLASGVIYRLHQAGFPVVVSELECPLMVRRTVCFGSAVYAGSVTIQGVTARRVNADRIQDILKADEILVLIDSEKVSVNVLQPVVIVDARMQKMNTDTTRQDAPLVIALGPGYNAGIDCHAVIETNRGHDLGRIIYDGPAEADTRVPGLIEKRTASRILRAPTAGYVQPDGVVIGDTVEAGQVIATVSGQPIEAVFKGLLRGLIHERVPVTEGMKIGDLDPRTRRENSFTISDKSLAIGGAVLAAVLAAPQVHPYLVTQATYEIPKSL
jgi:xanthine dehydrogenase accessory factor